MHISVGRDADRVGFNPVAMGRASVRHRTRCSGRARTTPIYIGENPRSNQPRPALGRRPWFALLRRARSLRRFALAIGCGSVAGSAGTISVKALDGSWCAEPVVIAATFAQRLIGVRSGARSVILPTSAVHGRGLSAGLGVVAIDRGGTVIGVEELLPGKFLWMRGAAWILEQPLGSPRPRPGIELAIYPHSGDWTTSSVCHPDRESQRCN